MRKEASQRLPYSQFFYVDRKPGKVARGIGRKELVQSRKKVEISKERDKNCKRHITYSWTRAYQNHYLRKEIKSDGIEGRKPKKAKS